jgi:O-antigen/teichoic acid export membrane protein
MSGTSRQQMSQYLTIFLNKTTSFLKLDVRYFGKNFTWTSIAEVVGVFMNFFLALAFAHFLSKDAFGHYTYVQSWFFTFGFFGLTGMGTAISKAAAEGRVAIYSQAIALTLISGVGGTIMLVILAMGFSDKALVFPLLIAAFILIT